MSYFTVNLRYEIRHDLVSKLINCVSDLWGLGYHIHGYSKYYYLLTVSTISRDFFSKNQLKLSTHCFDVITISKFQIVYCFTHARACVWRCVRAKLLSIGNQRRWVLITSSIMRAYQFIGKRSSWVSL